MLKHTVLVQITGASQFQAEVEIDTDDLDPDMPPKHLTGTFTPFDGYETICKALVHTTTGLMAVPATHDVLFRRTPRLVRRQPGDWTAGFKGQE
jgi:hypothetical protein